MNLPKPLWSDVPPAVPILGIPIAQVTYADALDKIERWVTQSGFEWLARLVMAPRKHFKRYVIGLPLFYLRIIRQRMRGPGKS